MIGVLKSREEMDNSKPFAKSAFSKLAACFGPSSSSWGVSTSAAAAAEASSAVHCNGASSSGVVIGEDPAANNKRKRAQASGVRSPKESQHEIIQIDDDDNNLQVLQKALSSGVVNSTMGNVQTGHNYAGEVSVVDTGDIVAASFSGAIPDLNNVGDHLNGIPAFAWEVAEQNTKNMTLNDFASTSYDDYPYMDSGSPSPSYNSDDYYDYMDVEEDDAAAYVPELNDPLYPFGESSSAGQNKLNAGESSSAGQNQPVMINEIEANTEKFRNFKHFDTVGDYSDNYFVLKQQPGKSFLSKLVVTQKPVVQTSKEWAKQVQQEWAILEKDLPDTIYVRAYEERMDLLRAVIVGAQGTPYHDGLFFFDISFPSDYPHSPPLVHYHSFGHRLNPNLYACGKVCLSLLNTWPGSKSNNETWIPKKSTILQVLVSIQAIVLNQKPYFNEPGYEKTAGRPDGEKHARIYNENTFLLSLKSMLQLLRKPPMHFEPFVLGHFRVHGPQILEACKAYIDGAQVGCLAAGVIQDVDQGDKSSSKNFKDSLTQLFPKLLTTFTDNGSDCKKFLPKPAEQRERKLVPKRWP